MNVRAYEVVAGLFWLALSIFVMIEGLRLGLGSPNNPDMGFMPFWAAAILAMLALYAIAAPFLTNGERGRSQYVFTRAFPTRVVPVFSALLVYALSLPVLGFLIGTFVLLCPLFYFSYRGPLWHIAVAAAVTTLGCWLLFQELLKTQFPRGIFGI